MIKPCTVDEAINILKDSKSKNCTVYEEKYWQYPKTGDDFKTCPMLKMMFDIEHKGGLIIHIPYAMEGIKDA